MSITGTQPDEVRYFWVYSENANGVSATRTYDTGYTQSGGQPDLAITIFDAVDGTYTVGGDLNVIAKIDNIGNAISEPYRITFYDSADTNITPEDYGGWYSEFDALGIGENDYYQFSMTLSQSIPNGQYYIGAIVSVVNDSDASNNTKYDETQITISSVPDTPTLTSATPGDGEATMHFTANGDGGSAITGYTATCGAVSQAGVSSPKTVTGLTNSTEYSCSVIATNVVGDSAASNVLYMTPALPTYCNVNTVSGVVETSVASYEACDILAIGPSFIAEDGASVSLGSGREIQFMPGFLVEPRATLKASVCGQSLCMTSPDPMLPGCHSCIDLICADMPSCCSEAFDAKCLAKVNKVCSLFCE